MDLSYLDATSPDFPAQLGTIPDAPRRLWVRGHSSLLSAPAAVAIVGSRRASAASLDIARRLAADLARIGLTIVSGLARGCDAAAHQGALDAGGRTVAVLGSGVDVVYPPEHAALADAIACDGAVLSECPPGSPPLPNHFRQRNRLISGLARGVVVIEANDRSGSLITAGCALQQGREVMVVPGVVFAGRNRGGHQLIRDGAALVENAEDVLAVLVAATPLPLPGRPVGRGDDGEALAPPFDDPVLDALDPAEPLDFDALARLVRLPPPAVLARLAELELAGRVLRTAGGRFVRSSGKVIT
jgi:DNA processing protein